MSALTAVILEDEQLVARDLHKLLRTHAPDLSVLATLESVADARVWFAANPQPDLVFADIQLADGVSFELLEAGLIECPVIFTTAYHEYALRAFKVNSVDYLLKPIDSGELVRALDKYRRQSQTATADSRAQLAALIADFRAGEKPAWRERFMVHAKGGVMPLPADQIACFLKDELVYVLTHDGHRYYTDYPTLEEVEHMVNPAVFFRANRQFILHLSAIDTVKSGINGKLVVRLKDPLPSVDISREKAPVFRQWMEG